MAKSPDNVYGRETEWGSALEVSPLSAHAHCLAAFGPVERILMAARAAAAHVWWVAGMKGTRRGHGPNIPLEHEELFRVTNIPSGA